MRVLVVSIALPPKNDPEALQTGKYLKYLSREVQIDAVTSSMPTLWMQSDPGLKPLVKDLEQTIEIPIFEPKYLSILGNKLFRKFLKPDSRSSFHHKWQKVVKELRQDPDLIYSRSFPLSSTIMAKKLKQHYKVPWIMHLSDPWLESPLFNFKNSKYHRHEELACFELASYIAFSSSKVVEIYQAKYPQWAAKFVYFPNVYDSSDVIEKVEAKSHEQLTFVYTGSLNGSRSLKNLIYAINKLPANYANKIRIKVVGSLDRENQEIIAAHPKLVEFLGFVNFEEVKKIQTEADVLLAVDFDFIDPKEAIYFPSKLLDYFAVQKPIFCLTNKNSTSDEILSKLGHYVAYHNDEKSIQTFIQNYFKGEIKVDQQLPAEYSAKTNAKKLQQLFVKACQN